MHRYAYQYHKAMKCHCTVMLTAYVPGNKAELAEIKLDWHVQCHS